MARRNTPTQADMTRALKAAVAAGVSVGRMVVEAGKFEIVFSVPSQSPQEGPADDLDAELERFEKKHGQG